MPDLTLEEIEIGDAVYFYLKPRDPMPHMKTTVLKKGNDRGRPALMVDGIDDPVPIFHFQKVKKKTDEQTTNEGPR